MRSITGAEFVPVNFLPARVEVERRTDGALVLRSPEPLGTYARCLGEYLERWAEDRHDLVFLAQRDGERWRKLTYGEVRTMVRRIATDLLGRGLSAERPVAILSGNSVEHALLALAAMHVGVPVVPVSEAY